MGRTLVLIKPDGVANGWTRAIKDRYLEAGLTVIKEFPLRFSRSTAADFYEQHKGRPYFQGLCLGMSSGECWVLVLEGEDAVELVRALNGATDPRQAEPTTIRHDFRSAGGPFNTVHGSDSPEAFMREFGIVSKLEELMPVV